MNTFFRYTALIIFPILCVIAILAVWAPVFDYALSVKREFRPLFPILVIESDDWGARRALDFANGDISKRNQWSRWSQNDCLETPEDLDRLSAVLARHHDARGRSAVFTANVVFESIRLDRNTDRITAYPVPQEVVAKWKRLRSQGVFHPQIHAMRESDPESLLSKPPAAHSSPYMVWKNDRWIDMSRPKTRKVVEEAQRTFKSMFGSISLSTVAPAMIWSDSAAEAFRDAGILYFQNGTKYSPDGKRRRYPTGYRIKEGLIALPGRIGFEPIYDRVREEDLDAYVEERVGMALRDFRAHEPVAISAHRINFVSGHDPKYARTGRAALDLFLTRLLSERPDLYFLTSDELGRAIETGRFNDVLTGEEVVVRQISWLQAIKMALHRKDYTKRRLLVTFALVVSLIIWLRFVRSRKYVAGARLAGS